MTPRGADTVRLRLDEVEEERRFVDVAELPETMEALVARAQFQAG